MFASKNPVLYVLMVLGIVACVIAVLAFTHNPLALLGLFFMPSIPVINPTPEQVEVEDQEPLIGFHADI